MTPDQFCLELLRRGLITVDAVQGTASSPRFAGKRLGCTSVRGYTVCTLHLDGERKQVKMHRLIWLSVYGSIPAGQMPDHQNRIKTDNRIENLRLVDDKGNAANRRSYGGEANPARIINLATARQIRELHSDGRYRGGMSYPVIARRFKVSTSLVSKICRNQLWKEA